MLGTLLDVGMLKKCTLFWCEAQFEVKVCKEQHSRSVLGSWDVEKVHASAAQSTFGSQTAGTTFRRSDVFSCGRRKDCAPCQKWVKCGGFVNSSWKMAGVGHSRKGSAKMDFAPQAQGKRHVHQYSSEIIGSQSTDFLKGLHFGATSGLPPWFCFTVAALRLTWLHIFVAGTVL